MARFNFSSFVVKDFDLEQMRFGGIGLLIVKGFANLRELEHYRSVLAAAQYRLPEAVRPIMISKANFGSCSARDAHSKTTSASRRKPRPKRQKKAW